MTKHEKRNSLSRPVVISPFHQQSCRECNRLVGAEKLFSGSFANWQPLSFHRSPHQVASQVLPKALQSPDHMQLPVRKMFQEAVGDEPSHILPIVVSLVSQFLLQNGTNGNHRCKRIPEEEKLQTECPAQYAKACCQYNRRNPTQFDDRG